jgi:hypothetical protein
MDNTTIRRRAAASSTVTNKPGTKATSSTHEPVPFDFTELKDEFRELFQDGALARASEYEKAYLHDPCQLTLPDRIDFCEILLRMNFSAHKNPKLRCLPRYKFYLLHPPDVLATIAQRRAARELAKEEKESRRLAMEDVDLDSDDDGCRSTDEKEGYPDTEEGEEDDGEEGVEEGRGGDTKDVKDITKDAANATDNDTSRVLAEHRRLYLKTLQHCIELALQLLDDWADLSRDSNSYQDFQHYVKKTCSILASAVASIQLWRQWDDFFQKKPVSDYRWNTDYCELLLDLLRGRAILMMIRLFLIPSYLRKRNEHRLTVDERETEDSLVRRWVSQQFARGASYIRSYTDRCKQFSLSSHPHTSKEDTTLHRQPAVTLGGPCFRVLGDYEKAKGNMRAAVANYEMSFRLTEECETKQDFNTILDDKQLDLHTARRSELAEFMGADVLNVFQTSQHEDECRISLSMSGQSKDLDRRDAVVEGPDIISHQCFLPAEARGLFKSTQKPSKSSFTAVQQVGKEQKNEIKTEAKSLSSQLEESIMRGRRSPPIAIPTTTTTTTTTTTINSAVKGRKFLAVNQQLAVAV